MDFWDAIRADIMRSTTDYWGCEGRHCTEECPAKIDGKTPRERYDRVNCYLAQLLDIVRRCEAFAERGVGEDVGVSPTITADYHNPALCIQGFVIGERIQKTDMGEKE